MHGHHWFAHIPHVHFFKLPEEVKHFYAMAFVRTILFVTGGLFLPLYIFEQTENVSAVAFYLLFSQGVTKVLVRPLNIYIMRNHGLEWLMFWSIVLASLEYLCVYTLGISMASVFLFGVFEGISLAFYWDAYHGSFGLFGRERDVAEEVAGLHVLQNFITIVSPVLSAVFIAVFGYAYYYLAVVLLAVLLALLLIRRFKHVHKVDITLSAVLNVPHRHVAILTGAQYAFTFFIPLLMYVLFAGNVVAFGAIKTIIGAFMALFSFLIARYVDRRRTYFLGNVVYLGNIVFPTLQSVWADPYVISVTEILRGMTNTFTVAISAALYRIMRHRAPGLSSGYSFYVSVGKSFAFLIALSLSLIWTGNITDILRVLIFLSAPFGILTMLAYRKMEKEAEEISQSLS